MVTLTGNCGSAQISNAAQLALISCSVTGVSFSIARYSFDIYPNPNSGGFVIHVIKRLQENNFAKTSKHCFSIGRFRQ